MLTSISMVRLLHVDIIFTLLNFLKLERKL